MEHAHTLGNWEMASGFGWFHVGRFSICDAIFSNVLRTDMAGQVEVGRFIRKVKTAWLCLALPIESPHWWVIVWIHIWRVTGHVTSQHYTGGTGIVRKQRQIYTHSPDDWTDIFLTKYRFCTLQWDSLVCRVACYTICRLVSCQLVFHTMFIMPATDGRVERFLPLHASYCCICSSIITACSASVSMINLPSDQQHSKLRVYIAKAGLQRYSWMCAPDNRRDGQMSLGNKRPCSAGWYV